jgi:Fic family protein
MTYREFLNTIVSANISDEVTDFAKNEQDKLDARNEKRRNTLSKEQKANEEIKHSIVEYINGTVTASEVAGALNISTQKASALLRQLVESGALVAGEVKVKGKGTVKTYTPNC